MRSKIIWGFDRFGRSAVLPGLKRKESQSVPDEREKSGQAGELLVTFPLGQGRRKGCGCGKKLPGVCAMKGKHKKHPHSSL